MAPKRVKSLLDDPPAASSSEEEVEDESVEEVEDESVGEEQEGEEEEDEEEEDDEEEEEEEESKGKPNSSIFKSDPKAPSSEEEVEDDSEESDSDQTPLKIKTVEPSRVSNPSGRKPIVTQPKKTVSKPSLASPSKATAAVKRPLESEKDSKRKKKKVDEEGEEDSHPEESEKKPNMFQRLWSEDDEIVILKGLVECLKTGVKPWSDLGEFLESIKKSLHVEVRVDQLSNKIKRLKKKYLNNLKRGRGQDPVFSKHHDVVSYELMKQIWGEMKFGETGNGKTGSVVANGKKSASKKPSHGTKTLSLSDISMRESSKLDERNGSLQEMLYSRNNMNVGESFLNQGLGLIGDSKAKDLEAKWRNLYAAELKLYLRRVELIQEQTNAILDAYKSSDTSDE